MIDGDDAAERRLFVRGEGFAPRFREIRALAEPARIGVLENRQRWRLTGIFRNQRGGGGEIENVVVRKFLPVELFEEVSEIAVQRRALMGILAVAQVLRLCRANRQLLG